MTEHHTTSAPSAPQHTTVISTDFEPRIIVQEDDGRWFRVLNWFYDEVVPTLSVAPLKLMLGMLRHRDNQTGLVNHTRKQFEVELRLSKQAVSDGIIHLKAHPCHLLVEHGTNSFEPMPSRFFASRGVRPAGRLSALADSESAHADRESATADDVSAERARARPARLVKTETQPRPPTAEGEPGSSPQPAGWSGQTPWPQLSLFGRMAADRGDVRGVLDDLRVRAPAIDDCMAIPGLSIDRILAVAAEVAADSTAISKPACLAGRLLGRKLSRGVEARGRNRISVDEIMAFAEMQRIRDRRNHQARTAPTQPKEPTR